MKYDEMTDDDLAQLCRSWGLVRAVRGDVDIISQSKLDTMAAMGLLNESREGLSDRGQRVAEVLRKPTKRRA